MIRTVLTALALSATPAIAQTTPDLAAITRTAPAWSDEFTAGLATGEWDRGLSPWPETIVNRILPGTGERQVYVDEKYLGADTLVAAPKYNTGGTLLMMARRMDARTRFRVEGRMLAEKANAPTSAALRKADWISALIKGRRSFQYGYIEASIRLDGGPESWGAFWLLPAKWGWPPEVDIVEFKTEAGVIKAVMGIHSKDPAFPNKGCRVPVPNGGKGFHRYGFHWNATTATFFLDGKVSCVMPTPSDLKQPFYPIVNLAIGGWGATPTAATKEPQLMQVDYIRRWNP